MADWAAYLQGAGEILRPGEVSKPFVAMIRNLQKLSSLVPRPDLSWRHTDYNCCIIILSCNNN